MKDRHFSRQSERDEEPVKIPVCDVLDLHTFRPGEVKPLIPAYLDACVAQGLRLVRLIHGRGTGTLRNIVHHQLRKHPAVVEFWLDHAVAGGATVVALKEMKSDELEESLSEPEGGLL